MIVVNYSIAVNRIDTYLPREGPETVAKSLIVDFVFMSIDTYLPREGPETMSPFV